MSYENRKMPRSPTEKASQPSQAASKLASAPGKRTRTMNLPPPPASTLHTVQKKRDPLTDAARQEQRELTARWIDTAVRPDLYSPPVQRKGMGVGTDARDALPQPVDGSGRPMPENVHAKMENAFGVDFSAVRIHEGPQASNIGALAYTQGANIHFAPGQYAPDSQSGQELLGHELAHVVQQSQGRVQATTQAKGVASNDDPALESEADRMGANAARGEYVNPVSQAKDADRDVHSLPKKSHVARQLGSVVQRYTEIPTAAQSATEWNLGFDLRVGDQGMTATSQTTSLKESYAHPSLIAQSNRELAARNSGIELMEEAASVRGSAPDGSGSHTLKKVLPRIAASHGGAGTDQTSWADCGRMSREVMGNTGRDQPPHAIYNDSSGDLQETAASHGPGELQAHSLVALGLGATPEAALAAYNAMSPTARDDFARQHGLNRYAAPSVGEAFSTQGANGFNFHWGGVVFQSGGDRVTLENFFKSGNYDSQDTDWYFQTYGPASKASQTWHDQWTSGNAGSMSMRTSTRSITGQTNAPGVRLCDDPAHWNDSSHYRNLATGTQIRKLETNDGPWIRVEVLSGPFTGRQGWIMAHYFAGN